MLIFNGNEQWQYDQSSNTYQKKLLSRIEHQGNISLQDFLVFLKHSLENSEESMMVMNMWNLSLKGPTSKSLIRFDIWDGRLALIYVNMNEWMTIYLYAYRLVWTTGKDYIYITFIKRLDPKIVLPNICQIRRLASKTSPQSIMPTGSG